MKQAQKNIVIMAGGTGGHIFPGLAVGKALESKGYSIYWLGAHGLEIDLVPRNGFPLHSLTMKGLRGNGVKGWLMLPFRLTGAVYDALRFLKKVKPLCVVGFGGFAAAPGGIAAKLLGIPIIIHEQNAVPGLVNKMLAKISKRNLAAFNTLLPRSVVVGNPVREALLTIAPYQERYAARGDSPLRILVVGGSQGARVLNELMASFSQQKQSSEFEIWHQTGKHFYEAHKNDLNFNTRNYTLTPFIDDMVAAYAWADLVVCRAGALTVSEILAVHVASCFIPFAKAVDDHQTKNAWALKEIGAAYLFPEEEISLSKLELLLRDFTREKAIEMAGKTDILAKPEATDIIVSEIEKVIKS